MPNSRLRSPHFNETFIPERTNIYQLLKFVSREDIDKLSLEEISDKTDIPTGKSSGKVKPTILYSEGMNLIRVCNNTHVLTEFGREVLEVDPTMNEPITLWMMHAFLSDSEIGAYNWNKLFSLWDSSTVLSKGQISQILNLSEKVAAPIWSMYTQQIGFSRAEILSEDNGLYRRGEFPLLSDNLYGLGSVFLELCKNHFPNYSQINSDDFFSITKIDKILGLDTGSRIGILNSLASIGYIKIQSLTSPILFVPTKDCNESYSHIYDYLC